MSALGRHLRQLRQQRDRSRRWVERQSRIRYPAEKERHISHSYLRQIEEGLRERPNPMKLQTLAEIYAVDYHELLAVAGYLKREAHDPPAAEPDPGQADQQPHRALVDQATEWLEGNGIRSEYFLRSLTGLSKESLALVSRLVTTLSIQEKQLKGDKAPVAGTQAKTR